jgi:outer membrane receptor protein involved in Fe transport
MSPNWLVNQNVDYTIGNFNIGANFKYISDFYFELSNTYKLEGSAKFGAYVYYTLGDITLGLKANNIFNKQSFSNGMMGAVEPLYFIDAPRTFFFDMRFNF